MHIPRSTHNLYLLIYQLGHLPVYNDDDSITIDSYSILYKAYDSEAIYIYEWKLDEHNNLQHLLLSHGKL